MERKPFGRLFWLGGIAAAVLMCAVAIIASAGRSAEPTDAEIKARVYSFILPEDEKGFQRMGEPKPGEWLALYKEGPQTLERYRIEAKIRPTPERRTVVIQPLGAFNEEQTKVLEAMREYAEIFFQLPVRLEKPLEMPDAESGMTRQVGMGQRHGTYERQYDAGKILDRFLLKRVPVDAAAYLGITMEDLWADNLNYVFGLGSFKQRVGVYSLCRYYPEFWGRKRQEGDEVLGLIRSCKVLNHETGHIFGLSHCVFYFCSMNGSNSLPETDRAPIHFCPVCHRKLSWNIGFDPAKRYKELHEFYKKHGLSDEAEWMKGRIERWNRMAEQNARKAVGEE